MVNEFGVHVGEGVGEVCAASGPAQRETATASVTHRIVTVRVCMTLSISRPVYHTAAASVKLPGYVVDHIIPLKRGERPI
jgi:hypothetical protein